MFLKTFLKKLQNIFILCQICNNVLPFFDTDSSQRDYCCRRILGVNTINCLRDEKQQSFWFWRALWQFCSLYARFTPSIMAVPALSSILTGLNPFEHHVHHNGKQGLSANFELLSEAVLKKGYRTDFSLRRPVLRKFNFIKVLRFLRTTCCQEGFSEF